LEAPAEPKCLPKSPRERFAPLELGIKSRMRSINIPSLWAYAKEISSVSSSIDSKTSGDLEKVVTMKTTNYKAYITCLVLSITALLSFTHPLEASSNDAFLNRLQGSWQGEGKAMGAAARLQLKWEWVLGGKFLRLSLKNEMQRAAGETQAFEGHAYYRLASPGKCEGKWFDSRGESFPISCNVEGEALTSLWGTPEQEQGKSVYRFLEAGKLEVVDSVMAKNGTWKEFGRFIVIRQ
jgi:hypothetical protein